MPTTNEQKMKAMSRVSLMILRKRMIARAPIIPSPRARLSPIACITVAATMELRIMACAKFLE